MTPDEDVMNARNVMTGKPRGRIRRSFVLLTAATALAACSTYNVNVNATAREDMNPNRTGGSSALYVYAFFLKKPDAFATKDKTLAEFLPKSVTDEGKPPPFLEADAVGGVQRIEIPPAPAGKTTTVTKTFEVPVDVTCVGLVAAFQSHRDNDNDEVWRLPLSVKSGAVSFEVTGKRLVEVLPKKKEAPRGTSSDG